MNDLDYAGDINPEKTWNLLKNNKDSHLIDCRTTAEWNFVGVPDLSSLGKNTHFVEWQSYPLMEKNSNFLKEILDLGLSKATQDLSDEMLSQLEDKYGPVQYEIRQYYIEDIDLLEVNKDSIVVELSCGT